MSDKIENQPAFPAYHPEGDYHLEWRAVGMSLLEYFMAHAPYPVPEWFVMSRTIAGESDAADRLIHAQEVYLQWPKYWAEQMIKMRGE